MSVIETSPDPIEETEYGIVTARNFDVLATSQLDARSLLIAHGVQLGVAWASYKTETWNSQVICRKITIEGRPHAPSLGTGRYICRAEYSSVRRGEAVIGGDPVYLLGGGVENAPADIDADGLPVANSADEPFENPISVLKPNEHLKVVWWEQKDTLGALLSLIRPYRGALNSVAWQGADPRTVLCHGIEYTDETLLGPAAVRWYRLEASFEYRPRIPVADFPGTALKVRSGGSWAAAGTEIDPWTEIRPDRGRRIRTGSTVDGKAKYGDVLTNNKPVDEPVYLDGSGLRLAETANVVALVFPTIKRALDFGALGI